MAGEINLLTGFKRVNPFPLDDSLVFADLAAINTYISTSGIAYEGQIVYAKTTKKVYKLDLVSSVLTAVEQTGSDTYPTSLTWTNGTTAGPVGSLSGNTGFTTITFPSVPLASASQSGVVSTAAQSFAGDKTFGGKIVTDTIESSSPTATLNIGNNVTTGTINLASAGTAVTNINIGHTNAITTITGTLAVSGTQTTINSTAVSVANKNLFLGDVVQTSGVVITTTSGSAIVTLNSGTNATYIPGQTVVQTAGTAGTIPSNTTILSITGTNQLTLSNNATASSSSITVTIGGATDVTANGGGIYLRSSAGDKSLLWDSGNQNWTSSENLNIASNKSYKINNTVVLTSSQVLGRTPGGSAAGDIVTIDASQVLTNKRLNTTTNGIVTTSGGNGLIGVVASLSTNLGGTGLTTYTANAVLYADTASSLSQVALNSTATKRFLTQQSSGIPSWSTIAATDVTLDNFTVQFNTGTTEGNDRFTYNGNGAKTFNIIAGTGIQLVTTTPGQITINNTGGSGGSGGITSLNSLTGSTQSFATGSGGNDFGISSSGTIHTFNIPTASLSARGLLGISDFSNFKTAYDTRYQWDGGSTALVASTGRTSLGATTVGSNLFTLTNPSAISFIKINADNTVSTINGATLRSDIGAGTVSSVGLSVPVGLSISNSPITSSGTLAIGLQTGYSIPTTASQSNWDTAFSERNRWDGGSTSLVAATGRTSLGATTVGSNLFTATNPSADTYIKVNADNSISFLDNATFRSNIGAGTVTSVGISVPTGFSASGAITTNGTITISTALNGIIKGNGSGFTTATSGSDYAPATSGSGILSGNGLGGFTNITIGSGLNFASSTLSISTLSGSNFASQTANTFFAAPNGSAGNPSFRSIVSADLPTIALSKLETVTGPVFVGNSSAGVGNVAIINATTATSMLNTFTASTKGLVPAPTTSTGLFLKDDGTWATPAGGGGGSVTSVNTQTGAVLLDTTSINTKRNGTGLTATLTAGTNTVTVASTTGLSSGQAIRQTSVSGGAFGGNAYITSITNSTQFVVNVNHTTSGAVTFDVGGMIVQLGAGVTIGGYTSGDIIDTSRSIDDIFKKLFQKSIPPTYVLPTSSIASSVSSSISNEVGTVVSFAPTYTLTYNSGTTQGGVAPSWTYFGGTGLSTISSTSPNQQYFAGITPTFANITLSDSTITRTTSASTAYAASLILNDNLGNPSPAGSFPSGTTSASHTTFFIGQRYSFAKSFSTDVSGSVTTSAWVRANLTAGPTSLNNQQITMLTGNRCLIFGYPASQANITTFSQFFNGSWLDITSSLSNGTTPFTTLSVEGANGFAGIQYKFYKFVTVGAFANDTQFLITI